MTLAIILGAAAAAALLAVMAVGRKASSFRAGVAADVARLYASVPADGRGPAGREDWYAPEPVKRYLAFAMPEGGDASVARLSHSGGFRTKPGGAWLPIEGAEHFSVRRPGFVWHACIRVAPGVRICARDMYLGGRGSMLVKLASAITLADASGPEMDASSLGRWLGEAALFPPALGPGGPVMWEAIDGSSAKATVWDDGLEVSGVFHFGPDGRIERFTAKRHMHTPGGAVLAPFTGYLRDYREAGGFIVPREMEAVWNLETGDFSYARFVVTDIGYE